MKSFKLFLLASAVILFSSTLYGSDPDCTPNNRVEQGSGDIIDGDCVDSPDLPYDDRPDCGDDQKLVQGNDNNCTDGTRADDPGPYPPLIECPVGKTVDQGTADCIVVVPDIAIDDATLQKVISSTFDDTPYSPPIDIQGIIDANGLTISVPYTVVNGSATLAAYSTSVTLNASVTQDGESGIVATFAWTEQTDLPIGSGTFTAMITIDDSAGNDDGIYNAKKLDIDAIAATGGLIVATFPYATDKAGGEGNMTLKILPGIPDRMFGQADNNGNNRTHEFLYVPVVNATTGKTWLSNNLGANYSNINSPEFDITQQATASTDYNAYGSLFQWGRKPDGHDLINWTNGSVGTGANGTTDVESDSPTDALFITIGGYPADWRITQDDTLWTNETNTNNVCPIGYRVPTKGELDLERQSWTSQDSFGAIGSPLKLPMPGFRINENGIVSNEAASGSYWGSTVSGTYAYRLYFFGSYAGMSSIDRANGFTVRCIKDKNMIIDDNFDNDAVGTIPSDWIIKYNGTGTANQKVVDTLYRSPSHSFQLEGAGSWAANIYKTPSSIPSLVTVEANIRIDRVISGYSGWFALYNKDVNTWGTQVGGLSFKDGKFSAYYAGGNRYEIGNFIPQQWYHIRSVYDTAAKIYRIYIDGALATGIYGETSYTAFPMHPSVTAAQLMLTAGNGGTVKVFYDDVKMY